MTKIKKQLLFFMAMLLVFGITFVKSPMETKANNGKYLFIEPYGGADGNKFVTYKDTKYLYAGDLIATYKDGHYDKFTGHLSMRKGITYKSSKPSIASIDSKTGKITIKNYGTTKITAKYNKQTTYFSLTIAKNKTVEKCLREHEKKNSVSDRKECAEAFLKTAGNVFEINTSNRYKILTAYKSYELLEESWNNGCGIARCLGSSSYDSVIYLAEETRINAICGSLRIYAEKRSPFLDKSSKCFKVKSISGKNNSKKITVKLKSKVDEDQIFAGLYGLSYDSNIKKTDKYSFPISVQDTKTNYRYYAIATVKKGSDKMTIETKNLKLRKGNEYKLVSQYGTWLDDTVNKNTFKVS